MGRQLRACFRCSRLKRTSRELWDRAVLMCGEVVGRRLRRGATRRRNRFSSGSAEAGPSHPARASGPRKTRRGPASPAGGASDSRCHGGRCVRGTSCIPRERRRASEAVAFASILCGSGGEGGLSRTLYKFACSTEWTSSKVGHRRTGLCVRAGSPGRGRGAILWPHRWRQTQGTADKTAGNLIRYEPITAGIENGRDPVRCPATPVIPAILPNGWAATLSHWCAAT